MPRVFTTHAGAAIRIGTFGEATNDSAALVPEEVAAELEASMAGEPMNPELVGHVGRPVHDHFRIERGEAVPDSPGHPTGDETAAPPRRGRRKEGE